MTIMFDMIKHTLGKLSSILNLQKAYRNVADLLNSSYRFYNHSPLKG
jgi:hypothetical protein